MIYSVKRQNWPRKSFWVTTESTTGVFGFKSESFRGVAILRRGSCANLKSSIGFTLKYCARNSSTWSHSPLIVIAAWRSLGVHCKFTITKSTFFGQRCLYALINVTNMIFSRKFSKYLSKSISTDSIFCFQQRA